MSGPREFRPVERRVPVVAFLDGEHVDAVAVAVRGRDVEIARAAPVAATSAEDRALERPLVRHGPIVTRTRFERSIGYASGSDARRGFPSAPSLYLGGTRPAARRPCKKRLSSEYQRLRLTISSRQPNARRTGPDRKSVV